MSASPEAADPARVVVDEHDHIVYVDGPISRYFDVVEGPPRRDLLTMVPPGLFTPLRDGLLRARRDGTMVQCEGVLQRDGRPVAIDLELMPSAGAADVMIHLRHRDGQGASTDAPLVHHLWHEAAGLCAHLRTIADDHADVVDKLQEAAAELQVLNDELADRNRRLIATQTALVNTVQQLTSNNHELARLAREREALSADLVDLLAGIDIPIVMVDDRDRIAHVTPAATELLHLRPTDVGRPLADVRHTVGDLDLLEAIRDARRERRVIERTVVDGHHRSFRARIHTRTGASPQAVIIALIDVTTIRRGVDELREARDYATAIVDTAPSPLFVVDSDLRVRSANSAFGELLGAAPHALEGRHFLHLAGWEAPAVVDHLVRALREDVPAIETRCTLPTGEMRTLVLRVRAARSLGQSLLVVGALDITDRARAEAARIAAAQLSESARVKASLLDAVSHELRTPLNAMVLWLKVLGMPEVDPERWQRGVAVLQESVRAESRLVNDLLDVAVATSPSEELTIAVEWIDPRPAVETALDGLRDQARAAGITLDCDLAPAANRALVDPIRLQQIVWRLVENAIKFTPAGGRVTVALDRRGDEIELSVRDTGRGIAPDFLPRVFEVFAQEDGSRTRERDGLGIGLALVRHLVERQGGRIDVASVGAGGGTTVTLRFPASSGGVVR